MSGALPERLSAASGGADADLLGEALGDERVAGAVALALRDALLRRRFAELRSGGLTVNDDIAALLGPHTDERGQPYYLSEGRARAVVYRKGERRP